MDSMDSATPAQLSSDGKKPAPSVSPQTYGAIDASNPSDLWMIKLPNRLASAWEEAPEGTVLGTLTFTKGGKTQSNVAAPAAKRAKTSSGSGAQQSAPTSSKISILIDSSLAEKQSDLPVKYTLEAMSKKTNGRLHPFTRAEDGTVRIQGKVSRTASAQVDNGNSAGPGGASSSADVNLSRYRTLLKNRLIDTTVTNKRFVRPGGDASQSGPLKAAKAAASLGSGFGGSVAAFGQNMLDAKERAKAFDVPDRSKGPPITETAAVRTMLFELFSKKQFWSAKEIKLASGGRLPEREMRDALRLIATYHKNGENRNMWELKSEFKSASAKN